MKRLWLYLLPFLFLPNLNFSQVTEYGTLELSDRLIVPYVILLLFAVNFRRRIQFDRVKPLMLTFLVWAAIVTVTINLRYPYDDSFYVQFSLLKLGKFALYGLAGYLTVKAVDSTDTRRAFMISLLASAMVMGIGLAIEGRGNQVGVDVNLLDPDPGNGYKATNAMSVFAATFACFLCGMWLQKRETNLFKRSAMIVAMIALVLGSAVSLGRGGWVGGIAGFIYLLVRGSFNLKRMAIVLAVPAVLVIYYAAVPAFHQRVEATVDPTQRTQEDVTEDVGGVSLGGRPEEWTNGIRQFRSPLFGTGFFHRGGESGLYTTGSHNFFLQMFLETGLPGGIIMLMIFFRMWKIAGSSIARDCGFTVPARAALTCAIVGGMTGEYYYGQSGLVALFMVMAASGALPAIGRRYRSPAFVPGTEFGEYAYPQVGAAQR